MKQLPGFCKNKQNQKALKMEQKSKKYNTCVGANDLALLLAGQMYHSSMFLWLVKSSG